MNNKIKILHVITRLDRGGSAINTLATCVGCAERGYLVCLAAGLSLESDMSPSERVALDRAMRQASEKGVQFITLPKLVRRIHPAYDIMVFFQLFFLILRKKFHIVHTHTSKAGIVGRWAAFFAGTPIIIQTPHGHIFSGYFGALKNRLFLLLEKITAMTSHVMITLTDRCREEHIQFGVARREKFRTIHSGVPLEQFDNVDERAGRKIREESGITDGALIVGSAGRLVPVKGYDRFIRAAARIRGAYPDTAFIIVGDGPLRGDLLRLAANLNLSDALFLPGWKPDPENWIKAMDIFLLTSLNEGMGRVLVEAMACGKPVVATDVGGVSSVVEHGVTGFLTPPGDVDSMAESVLKLIREPELRRRFGERGRERSRLFSNKAMVERIDSLYKEWIEKTRGYNKY